MRELLLLLEAAREGCGSFAVIEGEPGTGRTALLQTLASRATGASVLVARGGTYEQALPFGVARQLLAPLRGGAALALADGYAAEPSSEASLLQSMLLTTHRLGIAGPVVLIVDDAQWSDEASIRFLAYLARRVTQQRMLMLVSLRTADRDGVATLAPMLPPAVEARRIVLGPLSAASVELVAERRLGERPTRAFAAACHKATAGNPALVGWLLDGLHERSGGTGPIPPIDWHAAPELHDWLRGRLAELPSGASAFVEALAVLDGGASLADVGALAELESESLALVADGLVAAGILAPTSGDFAQPMLRSAVAAAIPAGRLALLHRRAARSSHDVMRSARHVQMTPALGDPYAAATLRAAGEQALAEGASEMAVLLWRRALAEPPPDGERAALLLALGRVEGSLGDPGALERLTAAHRATTDALTRAAIAAERARILQLRDDPVQAARLLLAELDSHPGGELGHAALTELESELCLLATTRARPLVVDHARRALARVRSGSGIEDAALLAAVSAELIPRAPAAVAVALAQRALDDPTISERGAVAVSTALLTLTLGGRFAEAADGYDAAIAAARRRGATVHVSYLLAGRAWLALRMGRVIDAEAGAREALHGDGRSDGARLLKLAALTGALIERGESEDALRVSAEAEQLDAADSSISAQLLLSVRARALAACGRDSEALRVLASQRQWAQREDVAHPELSASGELALVAARVGRREEATALAQEALDSAVRLELPVARGEALRAAGVVTEDADEAVALLREAAEALECRACRLEHARALVDLGAAMRRCGHPGDARSPLADARDLANRCGATALARRAHAELLAAGGRPRRVARTGIDSLTPAERRVARLAADGLSNREISSELCVSRKTVEMHLSRVYGKLDVRARASLSALLGNEEPHPSVALSLTD
jgi:DNA-binding CsgD family transcriptional regulator